MLLVAAVNEKIGAVAEQRPNLLRVCGRYSTVSQQVLVRPVEHVDEMPVSYLALAAIARQRPDVFRGRRHHRAAGQQVGHHVCFFA